MTETNVNGSYNAPFKVKQFQYNPQPDITIHELALLLPIFTMAMVDGNIASFVDGLPDEAQRHFEELTA